MRLLKFNICIYIISVIWIPFSAVQAQTSEPTVENLIENTQYQSDNQEVKEKKKKKSDKKELKISEEFYFNLLIDIISILIIVGLIYYRNFRNKELFFTYFIFNVAIFLLTYLLNQVKISMGAAFGLFAVFSMLRYRTEGISVKDMTYLFIVIAIGLISAIQLEYYELCIINGILILFTFILDGNIIFKYESCRRILYERIDLIKDQNQNELLKDLRERTGLNIHRVSVNKMDFLKDSVSINAYYYPDKENKKITETNI